MARLGANPFHWRSPGASSHFGVLRKCAVLKVSVLCWEILSALEDKIRILKRPVTSSISLAQEEAENFLNLIRLLTIPSFHRRFVLSYLNAVRSCMKLSTQPAFSKGIHFALTEYISQGFSGHNKGQNSNVTRFSFTTRRYMENKNWWNSEVEEEWKQDSLHQVMQALSRADKALNRLWKTCLLMCMTSYRLAWRNNTKNAWTMSPNTRMNIPLNYMRIKLQWS